MFRADRSAEEYGYLYNENFESTGNDDLMPGKMMVITIPKDHFDENHCVGSTKPEKRAGLVLESMLRCFSKDFISGGGYEAPTGKTTNLRTPTNLPKAMLVIEILKSRMEEERIGYQLEDNMWGYRFWIHVIDRDYNIYNSLEKIYTANSLRNPKHAERKTSQSFELLDSDDSAFINMWHPYLLSIGENLDHCRPEDIDPWDILSPERAFSQDAFAGICKEQMDKARYFHQGMEASADNFNGKYPFPRFTFQLSLRYQDISRVLTHPLPDSTIMSIKDNLRDMVTSRRRITQLDAEFRLIAADSTIPEEIRFEKMAELENERRLLKNLEENNEGLVSSLKTYGYEASVALGGVSSYDAMAKLNVFMQLRRIFLEKRMAIINKHAGRNDSEFCREISEFQRTALERFYREFMTAQNVTNVTKRSVEWFKQLTPDNHFADYYQIYRKDLSCFANTIVRMAATFDTVLQLEHNYPLQMVTNIAHLASLRFHFGLGPNVMMAGEAATGKSTVMNNAQKLSLPHTSTSTGSISAKVFAVQGDMSDETKFMEEIDAELIGAGKNEGKENSIFKDLLTRKFMTTDSYDIGNKEGRTSRRYELRAMFNVICAFNQKAPDRNSPMASRFIVWQMTQRSRFERDKISNHSRDTFENEEILTNTIIFNFHLQNYYLFLWEKAIESGVLPDIGMHVTRKVVRIIFGDLKKRGINTPNDRFMLQYEGLVRTLTMLYAIEMVFFSELALDRREAASDSDASMRRGFLYTDLLDLVPWGVANAEISIFVLSLLASQFLPEMEHSISDVIAFKINTWPPKNDQDKAVVFRQYMSENINDAGQKVDTRYVSITANNLASLATRIKSYMTEKPSENSIIAILQGMTKMVVSCPHRHWSRSEKNEEEIERLRARRRRMQIESLSPTTVSGMTGPFPRSYMHCLSCKLEVGTQARVVCFCGREGHDKSPCIVECIFCEEKGHPSCMSRCDKCHGYLHAGCVASHDMDFVLYHNRETAMPSCSSCKKYLGHTETLVCKDCGRYGHKGGSCMSACRKCNMSCHSDCMTTCRECDLALCLDCLEEHMDFVVDPTQPEEDVPVCIIEWKNHTPTVSLCTAFLSKNGSSNVLKEVIEGLGHRHMDKDQEVYILGMPVQRTLDLPDEKTGREKRRNVVIYQLFDTAVVKKTPRTHVLANDHVSTPHNTRAISSYIVPNERARIGIRENDTRLIQKLDMPFDALMFGYWMENGILSHGCLDVIPSNTKTKVWQIRQKMAEQLGGVYANLNEGVDENYPESCVRDIVNNYRKKVAIRRLVETEDQLQDAIAQGIISADDIVNESDKFTKRRKVEECDEVAFDFSTLVLDDAEEDMAVEEEGQPRAEAPIVLATDGPAAMLFDTYRRKQYNPQVSIPVLFGKTRALPKVITK